MAEIGSLKMIAEVAVLAVIIYVALRFLRETRGSGVVRGLALLLMVGVTAFMILIQVLDLTHLAFLFHPEIRRAITHIGDSPIFGRFFRPETKIVQRIVRSVARLSKERIGALM